jgi:hypothetical protein
VKSDTPPENSKLSVDLNVLEGRPPIRTAKAPGQLKDIGLPFHRLDAQLLGPGRNARLPILLVLFVCRVQFRHGFSEEGLLIG